MSNAVPIPELTITDYAAAIGRTRKTVSRMIESNRLPGARKVDGVWFIPADATPLDGSRASTSGIVAPISSPAAAQLAAARPTILTILDDETAFVSLDVGARLLGITEYAIKVDRERFKVEKHGGRLMMPQSVIREIRG